MTQTPCYLYLLDGCIYNALTSPPEGIPYLELVRLAAEEGCMLTDGTRTAAAVTVYAAAVTDWSETTC